jgi:hypothetical protein
LQQCWDAAKLRLEAGSIVLGNEWPQCLPRMSHCNTVMRSDMR